MIIDISKFVDFKRWGDFLNHSLNKSEDWTKWVTNDGKDDRVMGYLIRVPADFGRLYGKPLIVQGDIPEELKKEIREWMGKHEIQEDSNVRVMKIFEKLLKLSGE